MGLGIRQAAPENLCAMLACDAYARSNASRGAWVRQAVARQQCLVAVESGVVVGYCVLNHDFFDNGFVALIVVAPAQQIADETARFAVLVKEGKVVID